MAFIPTPNVVLDTINFTVGDNEFSINLWFEGTAPAAIADLNALSAAVEGWVDTRIMPLLSNQCSFLGQRLYAQDGPEAPAVTNNVVPPTTGALTAGASPMNVASVTTFETETRGRSGRGRVYLAGIDEDVVTADVFTSAWRTSLSDAWALLDTDIATTGYGHVIVSRYTAGAPRPAGIPRPVTGYRVNQRVGTQRRRARY